MRTPRTPTAGQRVAPARPCDDRASGAPRGRSAPWLTTDEGVRLLAAAETVDVKARQRLFKLLRLLDGPIHPERPLSKATEATIRATIARMTRTQPSSGRRKPT